MSANSRLAQCIRCGFVMSWQSHSQLYVQVGCPKCQAPKQFGPGVYVSTYRGKTLAQALKYSACLERQGETS